MGGEYLSLAFSDDEIGLVEIDGVDPDQGDRIVAERWITAFPETTSSLILACRAVQRQSRKPAR